MEEVTFEQLPAVVGEIRERLERVEQLLNKMTSPLAQDTFMSITEAASYLNLTVSTLYGKACRSEIPVNKQGKRLYFEKEELKLWVQNGKKRTIEDRISAAESKFRGGRRKHF